MFLCSHESEQHAELVLAGILTLLFEYSDVLVENLHPALLTAQPISDSADGVQKILSDSMEIIRSWDIELQARFIAGHPRIGETKNLSTLSSKEQGGGASEPTPPEVIARLAHLNACYEQVYPGLRYITFVNGRSRATIAEEMEDKLKTSHSLSPNQPPVESFLPVEKHGQEWRQELSRAVEDVGRIAQSRLDKLVVEAGQEPGKCRQS
ncbi:Oxo-4-hydroxy-4-carboxy-5-ureidoimidazoline decarboxylase [Melanogaster broomeanus]|nr:Oxo-4-hydroxy-4-carboxy-5-ureidoimidazoline decarboxylase [Melanogaster broomeanus]